MKRLIFILGLLIPVILSGQSRLRQGAIIGDPTANMVEIDSVKMVGSFLAFYIDGGATPYYVYTEGVSTDSSWSSVSVDTINEVTAAHGINVDGFNIKDGNATIGDGGYISWGSGAERLHNNISGDGLALYIDSSTVFKFGPSTHYTDKSILPNATGDNLSLGGSAYRYWQVHATQYHVNSESGGYMYSSGDSLMFADSANLDGVSLSTLVSGSGGASSDSTFATVQTDSLKTFDGDSAVSVADLYELKAWQADSIELDTVAHMLVDTLFIAGNIGLNNPGDTASMLTTAQFEWPTVQDSVVFYKVYAYCYGTSGDVGVRVYEKDSPADGTRTYIHAEINPTTGTPATTSTFTQAASGPGKILGFALTTVTTKPTQVVCYLYYYEKRAY